MKIVMTLLVRNEEDIIRSNIEFHLAHGVDFFIAMDNLSVDATPDILRGYESTGKLLYLRQTDDDYSQHRWVTQMARRACSEFAADWIINNDADEFWFASSGSLKQTLEAASSGCDAIEVDRVNFVSRLDSDVEFFADRMVVRETVSRNALGALLPGKVCHRAFADIEVAQGNHRVFRHGQEIRPSKSDLIILHFPMRTYKQFETKVSMGGAAYARNTSLPFGVGETWRTLYQMWLSGTLESHYRHASATRARIHAGLLDGTFVIDHRLRDALREIDPQGQASHA